MLRVPNSPARTFSVGKLTTCWLQRSLFHSPLTRQTADIGWFLTHPDYGLWQHFWVLPARRFQILILATFAHHTFGMVKISLDLKAIKLCRLPYMKGVGNGAIRWSNQKCICPKNKDKKSFFFLGQYRLYQTSYKLRLWIIHIERFISLQYKVFGPITKCHYDMWVTGNGRLF